MMAAIKRALLRFGGAGLAAAMPEHDDRLERGPGVRADLNARLKAIEVDIDVQARRQLHFNHRG